MLVNSNSVFLQLGWFNIHTHYMWEMCSTCSDPRNKQSEGLGWWASIVSQWVTVCIVDHALETLFIQPARDDLMTFKLVFVLCHGNVCDKVVCYCRLMSHLADVNIQSGVGMFTFYDVICCLFYICASLLYIEWPKSPKLYNSMLLIICPIVKS